MHVIVYHITDFVSEYAHRREYPALVMLVSYYSSIIVENIQSAYFNSFTGGGGGGGGVNINYCMLSQIGDTVILTKLGW